MLTDKFSKIATVATVSVMFAAIVWLRPFIDKQESAGKVTAFSVSVIASVGVYKSISGGLIWVFRHLRIMRQWTLGRAYLEGTWVGHYEANASHRFTIEYIDQRTDVPTIVGREFDNSGQTRASWSSSIVSIDVTHMQLIYVYNCKIHERKNVHEGLGVFTMVRESKRGTARKVDGYAVDLTDGERNPNTEIKIADVAIPDESALADARRLFLKTAP